MFSPLRTLRWRSIPDCSAEAKLLLAYLDGALTLGLLPWR